ncbi:rhomboid-related protein 2 [Talpa occidentalis]|uniref:rhomboid-related protein 2 n=1 Tax=Talpa occidentalis TaxID=50954 RepID=UPI00188EFF39|nr:rhomboid-related protein 2 [Talpa occidentalis]
MAATHYLEMEEMSLNAHAKEGLEEEEKMREDKEAKDSFKSKKVHRIVSKWMLPETARTRYLERANCFPPPLFIISISIAEVNMLGSGVLSVMHISVPFLPLAIHGGSLASSIFDPLKFLVGASGGVYALMGGYFMNVLVNFREMIPAFGIVRLLIIVLIVGSDMGFALYRRFFVPASGSPVSFAAHIAGGFAGMSIGYTVFSCFDQALLKDPRFWAAIAAYLACVLFAVLFNIFLSPAN